MKDGGWLMEDGRLADGRWGDGGGGGGLTKDGGG